MRAFGLRQDMTAAVAITFASSIAGVIGSWVAQKLIEQVSSPVSSPAQESDAKDATGVSLDSHVTFIKNLKAKIADEPDRVESHIESAIWFAECLEDKILKKMILELDVSSFIA
jgi:hypothetical protein